MTGIHSVIQNFALNEIKTIDIYNLNQSDG